MEARPHLLQEQPPGANASARSTGSPFPPQITNTRWILPCLRSHPPLEGAPASKPKLCCGKCEGESLPEKRGCARLDRDSSCLHKSVPGFEVP